LPARYVPPSGFGYPLDGLRPSIPCRFCFTPAALVGFTLRSFLLPEGIPSVSTRKNPPAVSPIGAPVSTSRDGPAQQAAASGFRPFQESLANDGLLTRRPLDAPMGLTLPGLCGSNLDRAFTRPPLTRFAVQATSRQIRRRLRVSLGYCLLPTTRRTKVRPSEGRTLLGFLHRSDPKHSHDAPSGLCVHLSWRPPLLATAHDPWMGYLVLPELLGSAEVPSQNLASRTAGRSLLCSLQPPLGNCRSPLLCTSAC
jgi:hypothetical protein